MDAISFGTDGWRATLDEFTAPRVRCVGQAVATYLRENGEAGEPIAVGYDARSTSRGFAEAIAEVLRSNGHDVLLPPRDCPTPVVAWAVVERDLAGACMITASHNPPEYNGVKFIPDDGAPALPAVTEAIEAELADPTPIAENEWGELREVDLISSHAAHVIDLVGADLSGVTVAYDAMHGSGRGVTDDVLERAGATVERVRCVADPTFGGTPPEPNAEHLVPLVEAVEQTGAALGVANDGDADRVAIVTPRRGYLDENLFFAALYDHLLDGDSGPAVRTVSTSFLIDRVAAAHGETIIEVPVGFKWVAQAMATHDALCGGEESGGFTIRGHVREKDGVLVALLAAAMAADRPLDDRVDSLLKEHGPVSQGKIGVDCPDGRKAAVVASFVDVLPTEIAGEPVESVNDADGVKVLLTDGSWMLVRPSGTEPKLRIYAEASDESRVSTLLEAGRDLVDPLV